MRWRPSAEQSWPLFAFAAVLAVVAVVLARWTGPWWVLLSLAVGLAVGGVLFPRLQASARRRDEQAGVLASSTRTVSESGGQEKVRDVTLQRLVRVRATLRSALNAAVREQLITDNPARWVQLPQVRRPHPVIWTGARVAAWRATGERSAVAVWTAQQTAAFLRGIADDPLYGYFHLIALRGLRRGEATGLAWPQVDLDTGEATICQQLQEHSGQPVLLPPKSVASVRTVALDWSTVAALRAHRERQRIEHGVERPDGFVFARPDGRPYSPGYLTHRFARLVAGLGLPPIRLHDLRHGAATLALASGADLKAIQDMLGHASIVLTADTYTSVLPEVARRTADGIARLIVQAGRYPPGSADMHAQWSQDRSGTHHGLTMASPGDRQER